MFMWKTAALFTLLATAYSPSSSPLYWLPFSPSPGTSSHFLSTPPFLQSLDLSSPTTPKIEAALGVFRSGQIPVLGRGATETAP